MWTRKELKAQGRAAFMAAYWKNVLVAFILSLLTAGSVSQGSRVTGREELSLEGFSRGQLAVVLAAVLGALLFAIIIGILLHMFIFNPLKVGCFAFFRENVAGGNADLGLLKVGFSDYGRKFVTMFLAHLYIFLWTLLLIVPGIMKAYSYRMVPFLLWDEPELPASEVLRRSADMMYGQRWNAFLLDLSFLGWVLLMILTGGLLGVFWINPYYYNTNAALYLKLRENERY